MTHLACRDDRPTMTRTAPAPVSADCPDLPGDTAIASGRRIVSIATVMVLMLAVSALATEPTQQKLTLVDQAVGDIDKLARSMRVVPQGLHSVDKSHHLYRLDLQGVDARTAIDLTMPLHRRAYYRISPGVIAGMDEPNYLVRRGRLPGTRQDVAINASPDRDGAFVELVPPNTVFILSPSSYLLSNQTATDSLARTTGVEGATTGTRIDARIDGRIDGRIDARVKSSALKPIIARSTRTDRFGVVGRVSSQLSAVPKDQASGRGGSARAMLSIRCTDPTRPATRATTPPVSDKSIESSGASVRR